MRLFFRIAISLIVLAPFALHAMGHLSIRLVDQLEQLAYDARLLVTMPGSVDDRIVIVTVDERSLAVEGQWPWPRDKIARLVDTLFDRYGAKVVGFDVVFAEKDLSSGLHVLDKLAEGPMSDDAAFLEQLDALRPSLETDRIFADKLRGRPAVLGYFFRDDDNPSTGSLPLPAVEAEDHHTSIPFNEPTRYTGNLAVLQSSAPAGGFFDNPAIDSDGVYRRVPLLQQHDGALYESLALAVTRIALGSPPIRFVFHSGASGPRDGLDLDWLEIGDYRVPVDDETSVLVPYRGPQGRFPYVSATDVLSGVAPSYPLKGGIVLVGTSALGLRDVRVTPVGQSYDGVEVHANVISGILDERIKHHPRYVQGIEFVMLAVITAAVTIVVLFSSLIRATLTTLLLMVIIIAVNLQLWQRADFVVPVVPALLLAFSLYFFHMLYGFFAETRTKRMLSALFGQYVPPELVEEMGRNPAEISMDSESRDMTVLFSDVRGFTSIAEGLAPRELSALMNEFLTPMTRVIHRHRGTIDKYMGDAIMAFWGAPLEDPEHARHGLKAALEMQGALRALMPEFRRRGWPEVRIGIGVNTGPMRVGNMGSQFRMAYTVMGDAVNLGARLEGLTKQYGVPIAVGSKTVRAVPDFGFLELDRVRVKGKDKPEAVYEPIGSLADLDSELKTMISRHSSALKFYRAGDWDNAESMFFMLHQAFPDRLLFKIYLDRIAYYRSEPPEAEWDGVFVAQSK